MPHAAARWIAELEQESAATRRLLERLPEGKLAWRPHAKSYTLGQQAHHVATIPGGVSAMLQADTLDAATVDFATPQPASRAEVLRSFEESLAAARDRLSGWGERELAATWRLTKNGRELMAAPREAFLRTLLCNHLYHHRGQLALYLRLLDVPLPSVYGPTADENVFA